MKVFLGKPLGPGGSQVLEQVPNTDINGLEGLEITNQDIDASGGKSRSFANQEIEFLGDTYEYLRQQIIIGVGAGLGELFVADLTIILDENDCCPDYVVIAGEIRGTTSKWCEGACGIKVTVSEKKTAFDCVQSTMIWESNKGASQGYSNPSPTGFTSKKHPRFQWCDDPGNNQLAFRFGLMFGFTELLVTLTAVFFVIQLVVNTVQAILIVLGLQDIDDFNGTKLIDNYTAFVKSVERYASGCGNYHPAPLMRDYIQNVCDICGVKFISSILNDKDSPYYNSVYLAECQTVGTNEGDEIEYLPGTQSGTTQYWVDDDRPNLTLDMFLDKIKMVHNAKWIVKNIAGIDTLFYEREDAFDNNEIWIDFSEIDREKILSLCYEFSNAQVPALADLHFSKDGQDASGDKRLFPFYKDIVEWNTPAPLNPLQVGVLEVGVPFGAVSVRGDGVVRDPRTDLIGKVGDIGAIWRKAEKCLLITTGQTSFPKVMVWNAESYEEARVQDYFAGGNGGRLPDAKGKDHLYNAPYMFEEVLDGAGNPLPPAQYINDSLQMTVENNLYHNFWQIRNPRLQAIKRRAYEIEFEYDCDTLKRLDVSHNIILVYQGTAKQGNITSAKVSFGDKRTMTIKGFI